ADRRSPPRRPHSSASRAAPALSGRAPGRHQIEIGTLHTSRHTHSSPLGAVPLMSDTYFSEAREEMAGIIAAYAEMSADRVGRPAFSERVMAVMRKVPRHEFVPA